MGRVMLLVFVFVAACDEAKRPLGPVVSEVPPPACCPCADVDAGSDGVDDAAR